jgi:hypothetical protein
MNFDGCRAKLGDI